MTCAIVLEKLDLDRSLIVFSHVNILDTLDFDRIVFECTSLICCIQVMCSENI